MTVLDYQEKSVQRWLDIATEAKAKVVRVYIKNNGKVAGEFECADENCLCRKMICIGVWESTFNNLRGGGSPCPAKRQRVCGNICLSFYLTERFKNDEVCFPFAELEARTVNSQITWAKPRHGTWGRARYNNLMNQGVPKGEGELGFGSNSLTPHGYKDTIGDRKSYVYVIECQSKGFWYEKILWVKPELFYKIGITCQTVSARFTKHKLPYEWRTVALVEIKEGLAEVTRMGEMNIHRRFKHLSYTPHLMFEGDGECFALKNTSLNEVCSGVREEMLRTIQEVSPGAIPEDILTMLIQEVK